MISKLCRRTALAAVVAATAAGFTSCADHDIKGGNNNGNINGPLDPIEAYTRAFVKEFGEFKGKPWSQAVSGAITVRTSRPTTVNVFAEVDGERYIFASLGSVYGAQPVIVNIPDEVKELIVNADGQEYTVKLGDVLDLSEGSRYCVTPTYVVDDIPSLNGFEVVRMPEEYREIGLSGSQLRDRWLQYQTGKKAYNIFDAEHNFLNAEKNNLYTLSRFYGPAVDEVSDFTIYPLYWRENVHGESDYLLGIYYYNTNKKEEIKMIDLEDFDLKSAISFKKDGDNGFTISQTGEAYDAKNLDSFDEGHFKGYHMKMKNVKPEGKSILSRVGFYIKSGLKPGSTPDKGRNYTHISFMNSMYNAIEWGDNYWNTPLNRIGDSYSGAVLYSNTLITYDSDKPERVDGIEPTLESLGTNEMYYQIIAFMSQPDRTAAPVPDYSDVVLALTY
ncbi:MAG: hypothetical protein K2F72_03705, partial [Muribaculaceae bacterium]|nr:hypothetical protein [Muribaculaceae bacterium]